MTLDELLLSVMQRVGSFSMIVEEKPPGKVMYTVRYFSEKNKFDKEVIAFSPEKALELVLELTQTGM
jgi:hypothetical protein